MSSIKQPSKQRKHVTTACIPCRESKVKCNGATPSCSYCLNKGRVCHYQVGGDKRKLSLRFAVELLTDRVGQLSQYILDNGLPIPSAPQENDLALRNALESIGLGHLKLTPEQLDLPISQQLQHFNAETIVATNDYVNSGLGSVDLQSFHLPDIDRDGQLQTSVSPSLPGGSDEFYLPQFGDDSVGANGQFPLESSEVLQNDLFLDKLWNFVSDDSMSVIQSKSSNTTIPPMFMDQLPRSEVRQEQGEINETNGEVEEIEELVNQLSERMGSLQVGSDGRVRFYGPTSHFNLLKMPAPDNLTVHRTVRKDGLNVLGRLGIDKEVPQELEDHLINLFFTWHNPSFYVVDRDMYIRARKKWRIDMEDSPYYSEALTNAMCCLGAAFVPRYHPDFVTYPKSVSDFFADRAKALLDIELDLPCVATIQAMVVLSGHDIGCKRDARGWLYSGMALRLAFDLGLHIDMSPHVAEESISAAEAELRRIVFWGTYTTDHLWGFFLGRPFRINMEDVTVEKPGHHLISDSVSKWSPYGLIEPGINDSTTDVLQLLSEYRVKLCEIMAPLGHALYGWSQIPRRTLQSLSERSTSRLLQWKEDLPLNLQVNFDDTSTMFLPHVLLLHMQYYQAIIHIHRPWMSKHLVQPAQPAPPQRKGYIHARRMCIDSGIAIAKLLKIYEKQYSFRRMDIQAVSITCSAALMLIFATVSETISNNRVQEEDHNYNTFLGVCFRALEEFSSSWESSKRAQTFLINLQRLWEARANAYNSSKRDLAQSRSRPQSQAPGPKRSRMTGDSNMENQTSQSGIHRASQGYPMLHC
ncbi:fungal-specific transcription factor domain-containing protein [Talaromyces proteolyticus]|uniref:Fungal-specific transcription factor domain-containing protein n=1 Tax=Talaromyces proteolyticus TaxID=1131652 RepID=A0AAD4KGR8_9EURO|nr:fungal-specific transcription factor domain-containing protein [Talaromyces proteolyticus]KAH8691360.1 fungal-specific transcription factor domain-containing protein [Talaromyces proteolyticus]